MRREVSGNYRMEVTAAEGCPECFGTGIKMEQSASPLCRKIEIILSICPCVRVIPRMVAGARTTEKEVPEPPANLST